jgi:hypothetical protein
VGLNLGQVHAPGATPLDPDEMAGLIPRHITLKRELDEYERAYIRALQAADHRDYAPLLAFVRT